MSEEMQSMGDVIQSVFPPGLLQSYAQLRERIESHPAIRKLREAFPGRTAPPTELMQYIKQRTNCAQCHGLSACINQPFGHRPYAVEHPNTPELLAFTYRPCRLLLAAEKQEHINQLIKSHHVPAKVMQMTFDKLDQDLERTEAIKRLLKFCLDFQPGETIKGIYLHGPLGVGKSALVAAAARELAERNVDVLMVYVPDFFGEIKNAIKTGEVESKLDALRKVSVLILDDIGAEPLTVWTRDEVLGPVLQRRMERLPIIYTSNLTLPELRQHISQAKDEQYPNQVKGDRLMDRIEPWVDVVYVGGRNRRRDKGA